VKTILSLASTPEQVEDTMPFQLHACGEIKNGELVFEDPDEWKGTLARGLFYLKIPADLDCDPCVSFCRSFYLDGDADDPYRGYKTKKLEGTVLGYSDAGADQVEQVQLEKHLWPRYFHHDVSSCLMALNALMRDVTLAFFKKVGVRPDDVDRITGGVSQDRSLQYAIFNTFPPRRGNADGFTPHKDSGFMTLIHNTLPGLEAWEAGAWQPIAPLPGYVIALAGESMEVLTQDCPTPCAAVYHRVRTAHRVDPPALDRVSFGVYIGPRFDQDLYRYASDGELVVHSSFMDFQRKKAAEMGYEFHPALVQAS
jgi:hypothetical protein